MSLVPVRLYLAGPMTSRQHFNFPWFDVARDDLRHRGYEVACPAEMDRQEGFDPVAANYDGTENLAELGFDMRSAFARDLETICHWADGIAVLHYWTTSKGARAEVSVAKVIGIPVRPVDEWLASMSYRIDDVDEYLRCEQ